MTITLLNGTTVRPSKRAPYSKTEMKVYHEISLAVKMLDLKRMDRLGVSELFQEFLAEGERKSRDEWAKRMRSFGRNYAKIELWDWRSKEPFR